ncbi:hypothetical protein MNBD_GAMMA03-828 [hydrothermal vent metagenome]|uniref:Uncharacterized protein n=1 Tax=hydrothermal vent metagenome TaxID=652676 RepID=A0A3B0W091_9ZZZZ
MSGEKCPTIIGLKLDRQSILAVKRIEENTAGLKFAENVLAFGVVANMLIKGNVPSAAFNIYQTDWEVFAEGLSSVSIIQRNMIAIEALLQAQRHQGDAKQKKIWEAVKNGCAI